MPFNPLMLHAPQEPAVQAPSAFPVALEDNLRRVPIFEIQFRRGRVFEENEAVQP